MSLWERLTDLAGQVGTYLADQWSWVTAAIVLVAGVVFAAFGTFAKRQLVVGFERAWESLTGWIKRKWRTWRQEQATKKQRNAKADWLAALTEERVGKRYLYRQDRDDPGMIATIIGIHPNHPETLVRVEWTNPPDRQASDDDEYEDGDVFMMDWKHISMSEPDQRHWTARMRAKSFNDEDGWIMWEPLPDDV